MNRGQKNLNLHKGITREPQQKAKPEHKTLNSIQTLRMKTRDYDTCSPDNFLDDNV